MKWITLHNSHRKPSGALYAQLRVVHFSGVDFESWRSYTGRIWHDDDGNPPKGRRKRLLKKAGKKLNKRTGDPYVIGGPPG